MKFSRRINLILLLVFVFSRFGFAAETNLSEQMIQNGFKGQKVLLFEPDIELQRILASGRVEVKADWSETGTQFIKRRAKEFFQENDVEYTEFEIPDDESGTRIRQMLALHRAVGFTIMNNSMAPIPTKKEGFEWTIGSGAAEIGKSTGADYGLFVFYRRGYASAGRVATSIVGAYFGVIAPAVYQIGFVTLVDLKTGNFVWFQPIRRAYGDLRKEEDSKHTVASLLTGFPGLKLPERPKPNHQLGDAQ